MRGQPLPVHGDGRQCRDFTYVDSVVAVLTDAIIRQVAHPDPVNLAFGTRVSLLEVIAELEGILGRRLDLDFQPSRPGDVPRSQAANETLTQLFPDISPTDLRTGLQATTEWFESTRPWDPVPT